MGETIPADSGHGGASHSTGEHELYIGALLLLVMITFSVNMHHYLHHKNFNYLSESALYLLVGFIVSVGWTSISFDPNNSAIQLNSHFFSLVLLPPIIFEVYFFHTRVALTCKGLLFLRILFPFWG